MKEVIMNYGIYAKRHLDGRYGFFVNYRKCIDTEWLKIIEPFYYKDINDENIYWLGYRFTPAIGGKCRDECIEYLKNVQWSPDMNEDDEFDEVIYNPDSIPGEILESMIRRILINNGISPYTLDVMILPICTTNKWLSSIISCAWNAFKHCTISRYSDIINCNEYTSNTTNELCEDDCVISKLESYEKILIIDDLNNSEHSTKEIINIIRKYNSKAQIYIFKFDIEGGEFYAPTATINPQLSKSQSIIIEIEQSGDCSIPYICVYLDKTRNLRNCAYIRLDKPRYVPQWKSVILSEKQKQEFIHIMEADWCNRFIKSVFTNKVRQASGYDASVDIWRDTFVECEGFEYDEQGFPVMPDYSQLTIIG